MWLVRKILTLVCDAQKVVNFQREYPRADCSHSSCGQFHSQNFNPMLSARSLSNLTCREGPTVYRSNLPNFLSALGQLPNLYFQELLNALSDPHCSMAPAHGQPSWHKLCPSACPMPQASLGATFSFSFVLISKVLLGLAESECVQWMENLKFKYDY